MKSVALGLLALILAKVAGAAVPTSAADEGKLMRSPDREPKHLQPRGNNPPFGNYDCIAEFGALHAFPPSEHWCILQRDGGYVVRAWKGNSNIPPAPDNPDTAENEARPQLYPREWSIVERPVSADLAQAIRQLWMHAILEARYPLAHHSGLDGTTFAFTVQRYAVPELLTAETWSPIGDHPPTWLMELGLNIYKAAEAGNITDAKLKPEVAGVTRRVERYYRSRP